MTSWKVVIDKLSTQSDKSSGSILELVNFQYGYIMWCLENNNKTEAVGYLKLAEDNIRSLEVRNADAALVYGYKAAFYGCHIALNKFSAPFNGPKSSDCAKRAIQLDHDQPFGFVQLGNVKFHAPSLMGGSKAGAIGNYLIAKGLMEKNTGELKGDWNYLNLLTTLAGAYEVTADFPKAKMIYEEILRFEPEFKRVKDELYPRLLKKMDK